MTQLEDEMDANGASFFGDWTSTLSSNIAALRNEPLYIDSYRRLCTLQAVKSQLVVGRYSQGSAAFFIEAHNDALTSHIAASIGSWRTSLQSLRGCIENTLAAFFYKDHPIEHTLWSTGHFSITFAELFKYAERHPTFKSIDKRLTGLDVLRSEYAVLSKAVHASATSFRMTDDAASVLLWSVDTAKASAWSTRASRTIEAVCLLLLSSNIDLIKGSGGPSLRSVLPYAIKKARLSEFKTLGVIIP